MERETKEQRLKRLLAALLDGVEGYESENGYLRYWKAADVAEARALLDAEPAKSG